MKIIKNRLNFYNSVNYNPTIGINVQFRYRQIEILGVVIASRNGFAEILTEFGEIYHVTLEHRLTLTGHKWFRMKIERQLDDTRLLT